MTAAREGDVDAFANALEGELRKSRAATRNGRVGLGNFYANSPDESELRAEIAANLYEEETGRLSGVNRCHAHVFYDLLEACGISREEADAACSPVGPPYPPADRRIEPEDFFVELAAYGSNVESPN